MIVWTPKDPSRFNGTTVVEWAEVSDFGQFELTVELNYHSPMLEKQGYAFVLVSAEEGGVCDRSARRMHGDVVEGRRSRRATAPQPPGRRLQLRHLQPGVAGHQAPGWHCPARQARYAASSSPKASSASIDKWFPVARRTPPSLRLPFSIYGPLNAYLANGADDDARLADAFLIDAAAPAVEPARVPGADAAPPGRVRHPPDPDARRPNHVTWEVVGAPTPIGGAAATSRSLPRAGPPKLHAGRGGRRVATSSTTSARSPTQPATICAPGPTPATCSPADSP